MSMMDLTQRLADLDREINEINNRTNALTNQLTDTVAHGDDVTAQTIRRQLEELQLRLEDKTIMRTAVESKLHFIKTTAQKIVDIQTEKGWPTTSRLPSSMNLISKFSF
jgi:archaellum component FlaC